MYLYYFQFYEGIAVAIIDIDHFGFGLDRTLGNAWRAYLHGSKRGEASEGKLVISMSIFGSLLCRYGVFGGIRRNSLYLFPHGGCR